MKSCLHDISSVHLLSYFSTGYSNERFLFSSNYLRGYDVHFSLFVNTISNQVNTTIRTRTLNVLDGVVLTEAIRYAAAQLRYYFGIRLHYSISDIEEHQIPIYNYFYPSFSAVSSWQILSHLYRKKQTATKPAPFVSFLPFSAIEEDLSVDNSSNRINFAAVPPTRLEIEAIIDILSFLSWKSVTLIAFQNEAGLRKVKKFKNSAFERGICVRTIIWMSNTLSSYEISKAVYVLKQENNVAVAVSLVDASRIRGILESKMSGIQFIIGTSFRASRNEISFNKNTAKGLLMLQHHETRDEGFNKYFMGLKLSSNAYSWFGEFWSEIFTCNIPTHMQFGYVKYKRYSKTCTGYETLSKDLIDIRYALVKPVLDSIRTIICTAYKIIQMTKCTGYHCPFYSYTRWDREMIWNLSKNFGKYHCNLNGTGHFNTDGYINRKYVILNFDGTDYKEVGSWHFNETRQRGTLKLSKSSIIWNWGSHKTTSCYNNCKEGEIEDRGPDGEKCCFKCKNCSIFDEIAQNNTCTKCKIFEVPSSSRISCLPLPRIYISSKSTPVLVLELAALIGILLTICIIGTFVKYRHSRVVKSTGRHLSITMMISVTISLCEAIIFFLQPTLIRCGMQKVLLGQCLGAFYIPLLLKMMRVHRIFEASKKFIRSPMLVSTKSQMILCYLGILANLFLGILLAVSKPTTVTEEAVESYTKVAVFCNHSPVDAITSLVPCLVLLLACTYFGYKTRHLPSNFNESFRISTTMYINCFLFGVYIPLLYVFHNNKQSPFITNFITAGLMITLSFANLIGIFGTASIKVERSLLKCFIFKKKQKIFFLHNLM